MSRYITLIFTDFKQLGVPSLEKLFSVRLPNKVVRVEKSNVLSLGRKELKTLLIRASSF